MVVVRSSVFIPTSRTSGRSGRMVGSSSMGVLSGTKLERFSHLKMELCYPENSRVDFFLPSECVTTWGWHSSTGLELQTLGFTYDKLNRLAEFHPTGVAMYGPWAVPRAVQRADSRRTWSFPVASTPSCHSCILCCSRRDRMSLGLREQTFLCVSLRHRGKFETLLAKNSNLRTLGWRVVFQSISGFRDVLSYIHHNLGEYHLTHSTCTLNGSTKTDTHRHKIETSFQTIMHSKKRRMKAFGASVCLGELWWWWITISTFRWIQKKVRHFEVLEPERMMCFFVFGACNTHIDTWEIAASLYWQGTLMTLTFTIHSDVFGASCFLR